MEENRMLTGEMATSSTSEGAKIDVSEELLRLLRAINDKLDAGSKIVGEKPVLADEQSAEKIELTAGDFWYNNTLPSIDYASELSYS
jgi:hypothetical protein